MRNDGRGIDVCQSSASTEPMTDPHYVRLEELGDALIVSPLAGFGDLMRPEVAREWKLVLDRLDAPERKRLVIDLREIPYFGSTLLDWLVQLWNRMKAKGGGMAACNVSPIGREIFSLARLDTLWRVCASRDEALATLAESSSPARSPSHG